MFPTSHNNRLPILWQLGVFGVAGLEGASEALRGEGLFCHVELLDRGVVELEPLVVVLATRYVGWAPLLDLDTIDDKCLNNEYFKINMELP